MWVVLYVIVTTPVTTICLFPEEHTKGEMELRVWMIYFVLQMQN